MLDKEDLAKELAEVVINITSNQANTSFLLSLAYGGKDNLNAEGDPHQTVNISVSPPANEKAIVIAVANSITDTITLDEFVYDDDEKAEEATKMVTEMIRQMRLRVPVWFASVTAVVEVDADSDTGFKLTVRLSNRETEIREVNVEISARKNSCSD
jgi:hypothetical protein